MSEVFVNLNGERFIIAFSPTGEVLNIKQRKKYAPGAAWESWYNAPYWHRSHKLTPKPARIIELAREKRDDQPRNPYPGAGSDPRPKALDATRLCP